MMFTCINKVRNQTLDNFKMQRPTCPSSLCDFQAIRLGERSGGLRSSRESISVRSSSIEGVD